MWGLAAMGELNMVPTLVFLQEKAPGLGDDEARLFATRDAGCLLRRVCSELNRVVPEKRHDGQMQLVLAGYGFAQNGCDRICCVPAPLMWNISPGAPPAQQVDASGFSWFPDAETALVRLAEWVMKRGGTDGPVLVLHATRGAAGCSQGNERASGILKTAADLCGAPGWVCNVLIADEGLLGFCTEQGLPSAASPKVRSLFRMASPLGELGSEIARGWEGGMAPDARCFEISPSATEGLSVTFAALVLAEALSRGEAVCDLDGLETSAFLMPKVGETVDRCEDVVSVDRGRRCFVISDGATIPSYSAEWARALCRRAVECPPPAVDLGDSSAAEATAQAFAAQLDSWLLDAVKYWGPEIPWERLVRPAMLNKAREGTAASLAGMEVLGPMEGGKVRLRCWALGDSCIFHIRQRKIVWAGPLATSADFGCGPLLLLTRPGLGEVYARSWRCWEGALEAGDVVLMATDALSEFLFKNFEAATEGNVMTWLEVMQSCRGEEAWRQFEEFVTRSRQGGEMRNDDVSVIIVRWNCDGC